MESTHLEHLDEHVHVCLFTNVKNADEIRKRIIRAASLPGKDGDSERETLNFAFIDADSIVGRLHLHTAIYQAILARTQGSLRTKTVHSEILFALNPSNNITESIRRFGVSSSTTAMIVVRVGNDDHFHNVHLTPEDLLLRMNSLVQGVPTELSDGLSRLTNWDKIRKYYKLEEENLIASTPVVQSINPRSTPDHPILDTVHSIIISSVAMKSVMS